MAAEALTITDPKSSPVDPNGIWGKLFGRLVVDPRDLVFVRLSSLLFLTVMPLAVLQFFHFRWYIAVVYLAIVFKYNGPVTLMLHNTSHRVLFRHMKFLNDFIPLMITPFHGNPPFTYYGHHIGMHHPENNLENDLSSTMRFQRDSFLHFAAYFGRFFFFGLIELPLYLAKHKRYRLIWRTLAGELGFYVLAAVLWRFNWQATLVVLIAPWMIMRFGMMAGNWGQHAFVDSTRPESPYGNSITCINGGYNQACFNDGYHIGHHLFPQMHWTEMPVEFEKNKEKYGKEDAIVFRGIDFFLISFLLWFGAYKFLASRYVQLGETKLSEEEIIAKMKSRLVPIIRDKAELDRKREEAKKARRAARQAMQNTPGEIQAA